MSDPEKFGISPAESNQFVEPRGFFKNAWDSFKPPAHYDFDTTGMSADQVAIVLIARSKPKLTKRHLKMISAAGGVGTGLFVGMGNNLINGGPAAILIGCVVIGTAVLCTMTAMGELGVRYPIRGSFTMIPARWMDRSWAFALSWSYALCWMVIVPLELITTAITIEYWKHDNNSAARVNPVAWISIFYVVIAAINLVGSRGYGEAEFIFGIIKVSAVIGFIIFAVIIDCGGGPTGEYIGAKYWNDPGRLSHGFKGVANVLVSVAFAFGGTEAAGVSAAEVANPHRALPSAMKNIFWRIIVFFIASTLLVGFLVPYNDPGLGTSGGGVSPYVLAIENAKVRALPSIFNSVIIISTFSVGNAGVFASSRTLVALATSDMAPKWLCYIDRKGRPLVAILVVLIFALLCFVSASDKYTEVFNWLYAFTALSTLYAWGSICFCHIRHRHGLRRAGISTRSLIYRSPFGEAGSWLALTIVVMTFGLQFWTAVAPIGGKASAKLFFQADLSVPTFIALYVGHKIVKRDPFITSKRLDVTSDLREVDQEEYEAEEAEFEARIQKNYALRLYHFIC